MVSLAAFSDYKEKKGKGLSLIMKSAYVKVDIGIIPLRGFFVLFDPMGVEELFDRDGIFGRQIQDFDSVNDLVWGCHCTMDDSVYR